MRIVIEIQDRYIKSIKFVLLALFIVAGIWYVYFAQLNGIHFKDGDMYLLIATIFAIYMAINLWANDVANNMWPAVWSKALSLWWAIFIAVIFEASGALIAWWDVVDTIKWGIINPQMIDKNSIEFIAIMLSTLLWAALWVNIATFLKAPVSITHAIFWWLIWAGITSSWFDVVNWEKVGKIASAWVVAIIMWWAIATLLFISIRKKILKTDDKWEAAKHWVPMYVWFMAWIFSIYLLIKWFKHKLWWFKDILEANNFDFNTTAIFLWIIVALWTYAALIIHYRKKEESFFVDKTKFVNKLFNIPLIFAVALLSFAHWANDVANAIWPLAAINEAVRAWWENIGKVWVPFWVMLLGALSLSLGLAVFGGRLIKTVWNEITKLDQIKAYCVALSAAITVIIASAMSLPVSTTQIAIWWVFGIGLYREYLKRKKGKQVVIIEKSMVRSIILSWIVTLPIAWVIASVTYLIIMAVSK